MDKDKIPPIYNVPRQPGSSTMVWFANLTHGGIIQSAEVACRVGEVLLEAHYGKDELEHQRPLVATDKGDYWQVDGSRNRDGKREGEGPFFMSIKKYDGAVTDFGLYHHYHPHPAAMQILQAAARKEKKE